MRTRLLEQDNPDTPSLLSLLRFCVTQSHRGCLMVSQPSDTVPLQKQHWLLPPP